jgi:phage host-nuclease inhibitor protein Gam
MKRLKRPAEAVRVPQSITEASASLAEIGAAQRELAVIQAALDETIAAAKTAAEAGAAPHKAAIEARTRGLQVWAAANRGLASGKTITLAAGTLGWRARPPSVRIGNMAAAIEFMATMGLDRFLRIKREINKEALLAEPQAATRVPGVSVGSAGEDFIVDPNSAEGVS